MRRIIVKWNFKSIWAQGFSIIELIIVIAVAGAIILVVANIPNSISLIGKSKHEAIAKDIATQTIESVRSQTFANLSNGTRTVTDHRISQLLGGSGTIVIETCPDSICAGNEDLEEKIKKVTVTVSWTQNNEPRSVILTTMISDGGLQ